MMCGTALTGIPAEAQVAWFGWSDLCFEGKLKTGSVTEGEFTVEVTGVIRVLCDNQQSSENKCQFGTGHSGTAVVTVPALADPTKEKGFIYFNGCIPGAKWDVHFDNEGQVVAGHEHLCVNDNTIEIVDTAHMPRIDTSGWAQLI
jgi:hypothetical protein